MCFTKTFVWFVYESSKMGKQVEKFDNDNMVTTGYEYV